MPFLFDNPIFEYRETIWEDTKKLAEQYIYDKNIIPHESIKYNYDNCNNNVIRQFLNTEICVIDTDCLELAFLENDNVVVLNLGNEYSPGGNPRYSGAQEEGIFRRSNYFLTLNKSNKLLYPIKDLEAIYSPDIYIFKKSEKYNYELLEDPKTLPFIVCCGIRNMTNTVEHIEILQKKIELIFNISYEKGHNVLILGALGCGAFNSPPELVANVFRDVIKKYNGVFKKIIFAILATKPENHTDDNGRGVNNYNIFKNILEKLESLK